MDTAIWAIISVLVGVGAPMTGWGNIYVGYFCLIIAAILALYKTKKWWIWLFARSKPQHELDRLQELIHELYNELYSIGKGKILDNQSVDIAMEEMRQWLDKSIRIISKILGQDEGKRLIDKKLAVDKKDEYHNPSVGEIKAFYNEKKIYLQYLTNLLGDIEKHPELWKS